MRVWRLDTPVAVNGYHEFGKPAAPRRRRRCRRGRCGSRSPRAPSTGSRRCSSENPFIPYNYYYDVVTWSYPLQRGLAGSGFLTTAAVAGRPMTEIHSDVVRHRAGRRLAVYAFNTDSMRGIGLAVDLLAKGVNVYRGTTAFTAAGTQFFTGAALVDGASLAANGANLACPRGRAQHPRHRPRQLPGGPSSDDGAQDRALHRHGRRSRRIRSIRANQDGECALRALGGRLVLPGAVHAGGQGQDPARPDRPGHPYGTGDGRLVNENFTAFINPGTNITTGATHGHPPVFVPNATGLALQAFVNGGGTYVGNNASGGTTTLAPETDPVALAHGASDCTPGSTFDATSHEQPGRLGLRPRRLDLPRRERQPRVRPRQLGAGHGRASYAANTATNPGSTATRSRPRRSPGDRPWWTRRTAPVTLSRSASTRSTAPGRSRTSDWC